MQRTLISYAFSIIGAVTAALSAAAQINPLPTTPPAADVIMRDSFGLGPEMLRPASGKGTLKDTALGTSINGFWLEYPGTKTNRWISADSGDAWRFCATSPNPNELSSPLQFVFGYEGNGILCTLLNAPPTAPTRPTALMPIPSTLTTPYEIEFDGIYWRLPGAYVAVGLTSSGATSNNLGTGGLVLVLHPDPSNIYVVDYEFRNGGVGGQLLASGSTDNEDFFGQMKIRYDPKTRSVGASYQGIDLGTFQTNVAPPKYAAVEGVGYIDNFVLRAK